MGVKDNHITAPTSDVILIGITGSEIDWWVKRVGANYRFAFVRSTGEQLKKITKVVEEDQIEPAVSPTEFKLSGINQALDYLTSGHLKGKVGIRFKK